MNPIQSALESILFIQGEPLTVSRLAKAVGAGRREVEQALAALEQEYRERGIRLMQNGDEWQFVTSPEHKTLVEQFVTSDLADELTRASLEVLSIVAYKGPISRAEIEYIRGVNSTFSVRGLLIRGLISRDENPKDRRSYLYRISSDFLKYMGVARVSDLPNFETFAKKEIVVPESEVQERV